MDIIVYSKANCVQCEATKKLLDTKGIGYQVIDLNQDEKALKKVIALGYREAPVVVTSTVHWSGFRPGMINQLCLN
ncbi:MAG: glutaredoxin-like protein NrdH [Aliivibrio sp.]|uniref:glutaredoxin-like protein NrdH n=1 Tax=Aliivibrio sp. TaxID=1872443 RepID=UPI001A40ADAE|nr:glutaredoxin-like protein NrdH [Aliivibrio sp.]